MAWKPCLAYGANLEMVPCMVGNGIILAIMDDHCSNSFIHIWLMAHSFQLSGLSMGSYPLMISPFSWIQSLYIFLFEAFFLVLWYSVPFLEKCHYFSSPKQAPNPDADMLLQFTLVPELHALITCGWAVSEGQGLSCCSVSFYQLWSACWAETPTERSDIAQLRVFSHAQLSEGDVLVLAEVMIEKVITWKQGGL